MSGDRLRRAHFISLLLAALTAGFGLFLPGRPNAAAAGPAPAVPAEYADLYATLDGRLKAIDSYAAARGMLADPPQLTQTGQALLRSIRAISE